MQAPKSIAQQNSWRPANTIAPRQTIRFAGALCFDVDEIGICQGYCAEELALVLTGSDAPFNMSGSISSISTRWLNVLAVGK